MECAVVTAKINWITGRPKTNYVFNMAFAMKKAYTAKINLN